MAATAQPRAPGATLPTPLISNERLTVREEVALTLASKLGHLYRETLIALYEYGRLTEAKADALLAFAKRPSSIAAYLEKETQGAIEDIRSQEFGRFAPLALAPLNATGPREIPLMVHNILQASKLIEVAGMLVGGIDPDTLQITGSAPNIKLALENLQKAFHIVNDVIGDREEGRNITGKIIDCYKKEAEIATISGRPETAGIALESAGRYLRNVAPREARDLFTRAFDRYLAAKLWNHAERAMSEIDSVEGERLNMAPWQRSLATNKQRLETLRPAAQKPLQEPRRP